MGKKENSLLKDIIIITIITIIAGALLGLVHEITAGPIAEQEEKTLMEAQAQVFSDADSFNAVDLSDDEITAVLEEQGLTKTTINTVYEANDASGNKLGYVVDVSNMEGYGGEIEILCGVRVDGDTYTVNAIQFLSISETAGLGMKAKNPEFMSEFENLQATRITVVDDGTDSTKIDAISGATITSKSVAKDVNGALVAAQYLEGTL